MSLPLSGVSVLDLADEAVVLAGRLLADLGADVVRLEALEGDAVRRRAPFVGGEPGVERGLAHLLYNAGKRSAAVALDRREGWHIARRLLATADIVIAPLEKGDFARAFFDEAALRTIAPRTGIVDTVFRRNAPGEVATDLVGTAAGGLLYLSGYEEDAPNHPAGQLAYKQVSLAAALAAVSLVLEEQISGVGGRIEVCMQEAVMWTTIQSANENYWYWHQARPGRHGIAGLGGQTIFETHDGRWVSFYQHPPSWDAFVAWIAQALGDRRFEERSWDDQLYRFHHFDEVVACTERLCKTLDRAPLVAEAQRRQILVVPVQSVADIAQDPHLGARGFFQRVPCEQLGLDLETYRSPFISSAYVSAARPAPALGRDTREVLRAWAGTDDPAIDRLVAEGLILDQGEER